VADIERVMGCRLLSNQELVTQIPYGPNAEKASETARTAVSGAALQQAPREALKEAPRASGTLESHYAPRAALRLMNAKMLQTALDVMGSEAAHIAVYARALLKTSSSRVIMRRMPDDARAAAQQLFAVLREFDAQGVRLIWVEEPPLDTAWDGVRDRLSRAAHT
jgi:L-threonylcarbamoyladenylate synthase